MNLLSSYIDKENFVTDDVIDIGDNTQIVNIVENILKQNKIKYNLEKHQFNLEDFMKKYLTWDELTPEQKQVAINQYVYIREEEENRSWNDILSNPDYDEPIDWSNVKSCKFEYDTENDTIFVII